MTAPDPVDVLALLKALAEPRRADIVRLLELRHRTQDGLCRDLGMTQPLVSHHLKTLIDAGLVEFTWCSRVKVYGLRPDTLRTLTERLHVMLDHASAVAEHRPC